MKLVCVAKDNEASLCALGERQSSSEFGVRNEEVGERSERQESLKAVMQFRGRDRVRDRGERGRGEYREGLRGGRGRAGMGKQA